MSQRSARIAAAIATADVSDPPRPSVVMRPVSLCTPWKPAMTATSLRSLKRLISSAPSMSRMRAEPCTFEVRIGICQPCHERALTPIPCSTIASRPAVTCSPEATTASYSRASMQRRGLATPFDQLIGRAGHGRDHDGDLMAGVDLALDVARDVADAVDIGDRRSAEFHHQTGHDFSSQPSKTDAPAAPAHTYRRGQAAAT